MINNILKFRLKSSKLEIDNQLSILQQQFGILENKHIEVVDKNNEASFLIIRKTESAKWCRNVEISRSRTSFYMHPLFLETRSYIFIPWAWFEKPECRPIRPHENFLGNIKVKTRTTTKYWVKRKAPFGTSWNQTSFTTDTSRNWRVRWLFWERWGVLELFFFTLLLLNHYQSRCLKARDLLQFNENRNGKF